MGQQQLLLLVLGIVIVGIAVVAGIQAFSEGKTKAESDAAVSDAMRIISDLQAWYLKPTAFGGGGEDSTKWANVKYSSIGISKTNDLDGAGTSADHYETLNGCYTVTGTSGKATVAIFLRDSNECASSSMADATVTSASPTSGVTWEYK